jgi:CRP/FNR family transcriptional regulator, cyclic AMP receptor protein
VQIRTAGPTSARPNAVSLLDLEPSVAEGLAADDLPRARRALGAPVLALEPGPWRPGTLDAEHGEVGFVLVLSGVLARDHALQDRTTTQLYGPGELVTARTAEPDCLPCRTTHAVEMVARVALLDERFMNAARIYPAAGRWLHAKLAAQADRAARQAAILGLPRVEDRVLATFWHLAEVWGRVRGDGVLLPLPLTHERIGRMTGAQRPTVSLALRALADEGDAQRVADGWLLRSGSEERLLGRSAEVVRLPVSATA